MKLSRQEGDDMRKASNLVLIRICRQILPHIRL